MPQLDVFRRGVDLKYLGRMFAAEHYWKRIFPLLKSRGPIDAISSMYSALVSVMADALPVSNRAKNIIDFIFSPPYRSDACDLAFYQFLPSASQIYALLSDHSLLLLQWHLASDNLMMRPICRPLNLFYFHPPYSAQLDKSPMGWGNWWLRQLMRRASHSVSQSHPKVSTNEIPEILD